VGVELKSDGSAFTGCSCVPRSAAVGGVGAVHETVDISDGGAELPLLVDRPPAFGIGKPNPGIFAMHSFNAEARLTT